jgi:hypothetical protein
MQALIEQYYNDMSHHTRYSHEQTVVLLSFRHDLDKET